MWELGYVPHTADVCGGNHKHPSGEVTDLGSLLSRDLPQTDVQIMLGKVGTGLLRILQDLGLDVAYAKKGSQHQPREGGRTSLAEDAQ